MRDLHSSVDESDLVDRFNFRGETTMNTENFAIDNSSDAEVVEDFSAVFPGIGVSVLSNGLIVEAIDGGDLSGLVITSKERDVTWVFHFEAEEELECFY